MLNNLSINSLNSMKSRRLILVLIIPLIMVFSLFFYDVFFHKIINILADASLATVNPIADVLQIFLLLLFLLIWFLLLFNGSYYKAFILQLFALPLTSRVENFIDINASVGSYIVTKFSFTVTLLYVLFLIIVISDRNFISYVFKNPIIRYFFTFFLLATVSQLLNHTVFNAIFISIFKLWSYFIVLSLVTYFIKDERGSVDLLKILISVFIVVMLFRIMNNNWKIIGLYENQTDVSAKVGRFWRVSSVIGPGISYGGYLGFIIIATLYFYKYSNNKVKYGLIIALFFVEMIFTFAKAGILVLIIMYFLLFIINNKKNMNLILFASVISIISIVIVQKIYSSVAPDANMFFDLRLLRSSSAQSRLYLWGQSIKHIFDNYGFGMGIGKQLYFNVSHLTSYDQLPSHNFIFSTLQMNGIYATVLFFYSYFKIIQSLKKSTWSTSPYIMIILIGYFVLSFTGPADLWVGYPFEGGMITIMFIGLGIADYKYSIYLKYNRNVQ